MASELRVGDLVVVRPECRWTSRIVDPEEKVGVAAPRSIEERRLVDDVRARRHRLVCRRRGRPELVAAILDRAVKGDLRDRPPFRREIVEKPLLVLESSASNDVE